MIYTIPPTSIRVLIAPEPALAWATATAIGVLFGDQTKGRSRVIALDQGQDFGFAQVERPDTWPDLEPGQIAIRQICLDLDDWYKVERLAVAELRRQRGGE